ncbi:MAG TPA: RNA polymerase sigma factor [Gammaproteobacteria bacterium]|nr:RNA polymerase sigma factor [Gammaproteobacteria bacterium]
MNAADEAEPSDEALMRAYARGDITAFDRLYARHRAGLFRYLRRLLTDSALIEDVYQDVWMRVMQARERYVDTARFTTWLYTIAHNRVMDHHRAARLREAGRVGALDDEEGDALARLPDPAPPPEQLLERARLVQRVVAAVDALPAAQREAFVLQQEGGLSLAAIAEATGVDVETAKSRLRYAYAKLRRELGGRT